jgi:hypothetical protein
MRGGGIWQFFYDGGKSCKAKLWKPFVMNP